MDANRVDKTRKSDDDVKSIWFWVIEKGIIPAFLFISLFALLVRVSVSLHPYSGAGNPPKYGDFEAQRHWMEITLNLPAKDWYRNCTNNDLSYWGLDYPPLTAYQSYFHGLFLRFFDPSSVSLYSSRGYESYIGKLLMRSTVLSSDMLVFFPAVLYFILVYSSWRFGENRSRIAWLIAVILLNPCLILIDHGHLQYNCISLGLTVAAVAAVLSDKDIFASILFSLALNHKQMSAYYAPAFFSHLLGKSLSRQNPFLQVVKLGLVVFGTFIFLWWPYFHSMNTLLEVVSRLTPFERGIYEDYVANFWCTTSVLVKWKRLFSTSSLKLFSLAATASTCLPSVIHQIKAPSRTGFLYGLMNSAFSFYLFSFQVHEKSILLPLLPASLLALEEPRMFQCFTQYALLSLFPLLCRDKLVLPYVALHGIFFVLYRAINGNNQQTKEVFLAGRVHTFFTVIFVVCSLPIHIVYLTVSPPKRYPFFFEAVMMLLCFCQFIVAAIYTNTKQWMVDDYISMSPKEKKKKQ